MNAAQPIALIAASTNLGLRPPEPTTVPGTAKAPEALRAAGLWDRLANVTHDGGLIPCPRYLDDKVPDSRLVMTSPEIRADLTSATNRARAIVDRPDLDSTGAHATLLVDLIATALPNLGSASRTY